MPVYSFTHKGQRWLCFDLNEVLSRERDMADVNSIVQTFVAQYYQQFDTDRSTLHCFYVRQLPSDLCIILNHFI